MDSPLSQVALRCASLGIVSHLAYFIRGEHLLDAPWILSAAVVLPPVVVFLLVQYAHFTVQAAAVTTTVGWAAYIVAVFASITVYRLFFHPLRHFPGRILSRISQFDYYFQVRKQGDNFNYIDQLHAKHGEIVRLGPNLLSIADPEFVDVVHNRRTHFTKAEWYDVGLPITTLHQMRDPVLHDKRRRHGWDRAFAAASLRSYDRRVIKYADILVRQIRQRLGQPLNATKWMNYYSFDVMGDLAFGRAFNALEAGESHFYIDILHEITLKGSGSGVLPWMIHILTRIPERFSPFRDAQKYSEDCLEERKKRQPKERDIISYILESGPFFHNQREDDLLLIGDARLLIVAGSDTTATTLAFLFYHLAHEPGLIKSVRKELIEHSISNDETFDVQELQHLPYLNAVINETLRLHPPVPGGVYRLTPAEGVTIGGRWIPGGVKIVQPIYTIQRSPKAFVDPEEFIPERWTTRPEMVLNKDAYFPFTAGRYACIGKQLALNEIRVVAAKLILEFDIHFAEGETGETFIKEATDSFTMVLPKLDLRFENQSCDGVQEKM